MGARKTAVQPAKFNRPDKRRQGMYAKARIAQKELRMAEDDYRQIIFEECGGATSLTQASEAQIEAVLNRLKGLGWKPYAKSKGKAQKGAQHPVARKARALWISLHHLNVVQNPSEEALEAFAKRQLGCEKLVWARQSDGHRLIEALKDMAHRNGWHQMDPETGRKVDLRRLHEQLCEAILTKLKAAGVAYEGWTLDDAAKKLCGIELEPEWPGSVEQMVSLAKALGDELRKVKVAA